MAGTDRRLRGLRIGLWALVGLAAAGLGVLAMTGRLAPAAPAVESYGAAIGGPFELVDPAGRTVTDRSLRGRPFAIFFGFTRCPDVCPTTLSRLAQLRSKLGADGDAFDIVFVSVDPGHDSPADIGAYVDLFDTPILGLTGSETQIAAAAKAYHVYYGKVDQPGGDYTIDHSATVFLMGRRGQFVATIDMEEGDKPALAKLRRLIADG
ncbi:MAG: SCO family protein [Alphaproteobacteria bacterium]|nr:SCO family protein [Alphaproteobacteria bacterium]